MVLAITDEAPSWFNVSRTLRLDGRRLATHCLKSAIKLSFEAPLARAFSRREINSRLVASMALRLSMTDAMFSGMPLERPSA